MILTPRMTAYNSNPSSIMSRQTYTYSTTSTRQMTGHGTSSAFSASANPDEDWTKISDLAERRRIQNRIAQRNYRKKLKKRLEDLERRAGSSSASPPQIHAQLATEDRKRSPELVHKQPSPRIMPNQYTPPLDNDMFQSFDDRDGSRTPPLAFSHHYPPPEEMGYQYQPTYTYPVSTSNDHYSGGYLEPVPVTLPSMMHFHDVMVKREDEHTMSPFNMSYQPLPAIDIQASHRYDDSNPHTPPLSHSYEHSSTGSESGYQYPTTPLSMPPSPRMLPLSQI